MTDIVQLLRKGAEVYAGFDVAIAFSQAADEIERLRAEIERLRGEGNG